MIILSPLYKRINYKLEEIQEETAERYGAREQDILSPVRDRVTEQEEGRAWFAQRYGKTDRRGDKVRSRTEKGDRK